MPVGRVRVGKRVGIGLCQRCRVGGGERFGERQWFGQRERCRLPAGLGFWIRLGVRTRV
jgi:hypothetical protein